MTTTVSDIKKPQPSPPVLGPATTETSFAGRFVALLTPILAIGAGALAGFVEGILPGVHLDSAQVTAFMVTASTSVLTAAWKWLQGWQQHELLVAERRADPVAVQREKRKKAKKAKKNGR